MARPLKFKTVQELQEKIDAYFAEVESVKISEDGNAYYEPVTITGLALALDTTRDVLINYQNRDEYSNAIRRAKQKCENFAEKKLYGKQATGPIFALKNFGWADDRNINHGGQKGNPVETKDVTQKILSKFSSEELEDMLKDEESENVVISD